MKLIKLLVLICLFPIYLLSNEIIVTEKTKKLEILSKSKIFIDKKNNLSLDEIKMKEFLANDLKALSYGYSPSFTVWVQITLKNNTDQAIQKVIEYANSNTTHIEFYDGDHVFKDGLFHLNNKRDSINPIFDITLQPKEVKTYYLKVSSYVTTLIIKLNLWDKNLFQKESEKHNMILAMFFASMLILALYNLFIYFFTKDRSYMFYVIYMFGVIIHQLAYTGFGNIYLFPQSFSIYLVEAASLIVAFPLVAFALLVKSFIKTKQYPIFNKILNIYLLAFPFLLSIFFITDIFAAYRNIFSVILLIFLIVLTLYSSIKRNRQAYFVLIGWIMFAFAFIFMYLSGIGFIDIFDHFKYFVELALVFEAIIFSIALADKINQLERKKNEANMELILQKGIETARLKTQIKQKTQELKTALDEKSLLLQELNHRVKNTMQTIVSLIRLQSDKYADKEIVELLQTIQNRINAMGCLHGLLYQQSDISYIDTKKYFELLISELQEGFESEGVQIKYQIDVNLPSEIAVYCGLIINELVTNAFKYAFEQNQGVIRIILKKEEGEFYLQVSDNGKGYSEKETKENLGSLLIQTLATKQLKGKIKKETSNGVKVEIIWS